MLHFPHIVHCCSSSFQPLSETLGFSSCLFKAPLPIKLMEFFLPINHDVVQLLFTTAWNLFLASNWAQAHKWLWSLFQDQSAPLQRCDTYASKHQTISKNLTRGCVLQSRACEVSACSSRMAGSFEGLCCFVVENENDTGTSESELFSCCSLIGSHDGCLLWHFEEKGWAEK